MKTQTRIRKAPGSPNGMAQSPANIPMKRRISAIFVSRNPTIGKQKPNRQGFVQRRSKKRAVIDRPYSCLALLGHDEIEEYASVVVSQVGQVVGEVGEVLAGADLHVL